jgi:sugar (pentulose or hexulose) kinase
MTAANPRFIAVIDIGKTNAKVALVDLETRAEIAVEKTPNTVTQGPPYPHFHCERLFAFILNSLAKLANTNRIDAISITTHGATAALITENGSLALPVLDYEHGGPDTVWSKYESIRPPFAETGSPQLPVGLNLGAQLFWQAKTFPTEFARVRHILMYPQYWGFRLTGIAASEVTSLGCHTDLWNPWERTFSTLVSQSAAKTGVDWQPLFPPLRNASDVLGRIKPDLAKQIGLPDTIPVHCGIHDSNASLLPWLGLPDKSFAVVSTGTWIISLAVGAKRVALDPARDTLINVNARGEPTPTARFMGGREFDQITSGVQAASQQDLQSVLHDRIMLMPAVENASGPFPRRQHSWTPHEPRSDGERFAAASFYCALMTATCLDLIGAEGPVIVEGPFAANPHYLAMLGAVIDRPVLTSTGSTTGTAIGAAMLAGHASQTSQQLKGGTDILANRQRYGEYGALWYSRVLSGSAGAAN